jgi:cytochrome P450
MNNTILNWDDADFRAIYTRQLKEHPLYYDPNLKLWITYSYEYCKAVLLSTDALVPEHFIDENSKMNKKMRLLVRNLARVSNDQQHLQSRTAAMTIYQSISTVSIDQVLKQLLDRIDTCAGFDSVDVVGKKLPVKVILKGLGIDGEDSTYITENLASLVRIMLPNKTVGDIELLNPVVDRFYDIGERYVVSRKFSANLPEEIGLIVCNLIGLFIQCYDAGRGLLCNALLRLAADDNRRSHAMVDTSYYRDLINETLRWDPPVHNTRRIAVNDICLGGETIKKGEAILIILAAANLDDEVFKDPNKFDLTRANNDQHLTFGLGGHNCVAKYLSIGMAADTCRFLTDNYQNINILQNVFNYEPQLNVRLVKQLMISLF